MRCVSCPVPARGAACLGQTIPRLCTLARFRQDYRHQLVRLARTQGEASPHTPRDLDAILATVASCSNRGSVLPLDEQPECGCSELTKCREGRGAVAGRVTLQDCITCVIERNP